MHAVNIDGENYSVDRPARMDKKTEQ